MATGGPQFHDREGTKLMCQLCDMKVDICIYNCVECDIYMCDNCTKVHNRLKNNRDHNVLKDQHRPLPPPRAKTRCTTHPGEDVIFYCYTCVIFICSFCITSTHSNHKCSMIKQASDEMSAELQDHINDIKDNHITVLRSDVNKLEMCQEDNDKRHDSNVQNIKARTDKLVHEINKIQSKFIQESEKTTTEKKIRLSEQRDYVATKVEELESKCSNYNKVLTSGSDIDKIMARNEAVKLLGQHQEHVQQEIIQNSIFIPGENDITSLERSFGCVVGPEDGETSDADIFNSEPGKKEFATIWNQSNLQMKI